MNKLINVCPLCFRFYECKQYCNIIVVLRNKLLQKYAMILVKTTTLPIRRVRRSQGLGQLVMSVPYRVCCCSWRSTFKREMRCDVMNGDGGGLALTEGPTGEKGDNYSTSDALTQTVRQVPSSADITDSIL